LKNTSTLKNPFTYKGAFGYYYDEETGLYYLKARYYDPKIYRFISRDPIEKAPELADLQNPLSLNPYLYCEDDPVGKVDPSGNIWIYIVAIGKIAITAYIVYRVVSFWWYVRKLNYHMRYVRQYKRGIVRAYRKRFGWVPSSSFLYRTLRRTWHGRMALYYAGKIGLRGIIAGAMGRPY
jgi:RHS repeat-associated protein